MPDRATAPRILILDNSPRRLGSAWFGKWFRQLGCRVSAYHFWQKTRPVALDNFDALVISGSPASATEDAPWILAELELVEQADQRQMPVLGVCFGAQLLGRAYFGKAAIQQSEQPEFGWYVVNRTGQKDVLMNEIPGQFTSFQFHTEEVLVQPAMHVLATSQTTAVQGFRVDNKPIWGIQFHLEVTPQAGRDLLRKTRRVYEPWGLTYEEMITTARPSEAAPQLFCNFLKLARKDIP